MTFIQMKIKFVSGQHEPDLTIHVNDDDTIRAVVQQVCEAKHIPPTKRVRILCAGRELYADDLISKAPSRVLHCLVTDIEPERPGLAPQRKGLQPPPPVVDQPPLDWLDMVDPGTVLMWIFGSILALLWVLFIFYANMFDRTSVVMLLMMTVAFLIPCVFSYLPCPAFLQPRPQPIGPEPEPPEAYDSATGRSTALSGHATWQRHPYRGEIPPRPPARVRPGS